jgi:hypothetical protein
VMYAFNEMETIFVVDVSKILFLLPDHIMFSN